MSLYNLLGDSFQISGVKPKYYQRPLKQFSTFYRNPLTLRRLGLLREDKWLHFKLYNGTLNPTTVTGISMTDVEGFYWYADRAETNFVFPFDIPARSYVDLYVKVTLDGMVEFDSTMTVASPSGDQLIRYTGIRTQFVSGSIANMSELHDWSSSIPETLSWKTDILESYDGTEQRIARRAKPRRILKLSYLEAGRARRVLEAKLYNRNVDFYAVPLWLESSFISGPVAAGSSEIPVVTHGRDFAQDNIAMLVHANGVDAERITLFTVSDTNLTTFAPVSRAYPVGSRVVPARFCNMVSDPSLSDLSDEVMRANCSFLSVGEEVRETIDIVPLYFKNHLVFPEELEADFDVGDTVFSIHGVLLDQGLSLPVNRLKSDEVKSNRPITITAVGASTTVILRDFVYSLYGMTVPFWCPTYTKAAVVIEDIAAGSSLLRVQYIGYTHYYDQSVGRSCLVIELHNGTKYRRGVTGAAINPVDVTEEFLELDETIVESVTISQIKSVKFLELVRSNTDDITFDWLAVDNAKCQIPVVSVRG